MKKGRLGFTNGILVLSLSLMLCPSLLAQAQRGGPKLSFVDSTAQTALRILPLLQTDAKDQNIAFSPFGLAYSAAMLQNGADERARKEIWDTFGFVAGSPDELNRQALALRDRIIPRESPEPKAPRVRLLASGEYVELSSSVATRPGIRFRPAFLKIAHDLYGAELDAFKKSQDRGKSDRPALGGIEAPSGLAAQMEQFGFVLLSKVRAGCRWGGWHTSGGPDLSMLARPSHRDQVINEILNLSAIPEPQEEKLPKLPKATFTIPGGAEVKVPLIERDGFFSYYRGDGFQAVTTGCGSFQYSVFLPDEDKSVPWLENNMTVQSLVESQRKSQRAEMRVFMPEFRVENEIGLKKHLRALGMNYSFTSFSSFSQLTTNPAGAVLTDAGQKAYVKVDEHGIEAEATTGLFGVVGGVAGGSPPDPPPLLVINRPFLFIITDTDTHTNLFIGAVHDPRSGWESKP